MYECVLSISAVDLATFTTIHGNIRQHKAKEDTDDEEHIYRTREGELHKYYQLG